MFVSSGVYNCKTYLLIDSHFIHFW